LAIHAHTLVSTLMTRFPYTEDVFDWHAVPHDEELYRRMSLYALCWVRGIELQQLIADLEAVIAAEEDETDELSPDEWTDEQRKPLLAEDDEDDDASWDRSDVEVDAPDLAFESALG